MGSLPIQSTPPPTNPIITPSTIPLTRTSIISAHELIKPYIHRTPVLTCSYLDELASTPQTAAALLQDGGTPHAEQLQERAARPRMRFFFKCENLQKVGAFKMRGATHALARLREEDDKNGGKGKRRLEKGVVTHSSGI